MEAAGGAGGAAAGGTEYWHGAHSLTVGGKATLVSPASDMICALYTLHGFIKPSGSTWYHSSKFVGFQFSFYAVAGSSQTMKKGHV